MKTARDNQYWSIIHDTEHDILFCEWKEGNEYQLDDEIFKEEMLHYAAIVEECQASKLLLNLRHGNYSMAPVIQEWVATDIAPRTIAAGQRKIATVLSDNLFAQVSLQQLMEEGDIPLIQQQYFDNREQAINWLKEG
jgi:hypothetical protein